MNERDFVALLRQHVRDDAVEGVIKILENPPGRRPAQEISELGAWYLGLAAEDRERVRRVMGLLAHHVTFGMLAVLDGARPLSAGDGPNGHFELDYVEPSGERTALVSESGGVLHEHL